ncbi:kinesin-like protein KIF20A [Hylaeus volcanicus]|uniref:kinesin-like protein KIF20A n=1 Tax=Hylaeus volcanicus TaxID=313075 RepID=UPI0023B80E7D|nr:kinesin-like protein KIF20A [Hylaeus volcanicus]
MDKTVDSIRPSSNPIPQEDMSYLFGRDPSILAYNHRPCISQQTRKNLLSVYDVEESCFIEDTTSLNSDSQTFQTVKVYLRMKPFPRKLKLTQEQQDAYNIINSTTLFTRLPTLDTNTSCLKRSNSTDIICRRFTFTKTFGPEITQLELFEQAVKQQMMDFLTGQNSTIMTYGTTNSGKSYTLQGTTTSPGIIPRCLEFVFSNITTKSTPSYKPVNHCDVVSVNPLERAQELEIKTKLLTFASVDKYQYINAYKEMQKLLQEEVPIRPSQCIDAHYSVWVSFAEIYNETVYDLLSNESKNRRTPLKVVTDANGRAFIKGLKTICVNSGSEAYQVLMAGQYNLKVAATALNARSSRSHCIFTIKLLKYYIENDPNSVEVSTFTFCDLAGSERLKKTLNIGDRLKEAQNINTSLMVLGRCLKTIHDGQISKQKIEQVGPFRESKLTRLFQKALSGKEHIALIVNINPVPNLYIETQSVLNFSAIAKKIVIEQKEKVKKKSKTRFTEIVRQSVKTVTDWDATELGSEDWQDVDDNSLSSYVHAEEHRELMCENERLKKEIAALKNSAFSRDLQIRQEVADTYTTMMKKLEVDWKNRIKDVEKEQEDILAWSLKKVEDFYKQKLNEHDGRKRRRSSVDADDDNEKIIEELEKRNSRLETQVVELRSSIKELKNSNKSVMVDKNKVIFELSMVKDDLKNVKSLLDAAQHVISSDEDTKYYIEELETQLVAKQEQVKKLKIFLNEAKEEYISITTEMMEKTHIIKEQEEELFEKQETIDDLEADLGNINICLTEKSKTVEILEEKLENQSKKIMEKDNELRNMQEYINKLESEKCLLLDEVQLLKKTASIESSIKNVKCEKDLFEESDDAVEDEDLDKVVLSLETQPVAKEEILENEKLEPQMKEKIMSVEAENSALKEKLTQSSTEIQSLKEELESAKLKLKDIADQICNLQIINVKPTVENDVHDKSSQTNTQPEKEQADDTENDAHHKSSQTIESMTKEEISQTSFVGEIEDYDAILDQLAKLTVKHDDIKLRYQEKCSILEEVEEEVSSLKQRIESLSEESNTNEVVLTKYKQSIESLQNEISVIKEGKKHVEEALQHSDDLKNTLESKITNYEQRLNDAEKELSVTKKDYDQCMEKLNTLQGDFDSHVSKCKNEHEPTINNLQKELDVAKEKFDIKSQCLDVHVTKLRELEHDHENITELEKQIGELNRQLEVCRGEKERLQKLLDENNDKRLELEDQLEHAEELQHEKDIEISSLQSEIKHLIQKTDNDDQNDKLMEKGMKDTIKQLTETKEMLSEKDEYIKTLKQHVQSLEQNAMVLNVLQQSNQERQAENDRLRSLNEELKNSLIEKEREMEAFMKHRDEMVAMYENLVKRQQEDIAKQKTMVTENEAKKKEYCENTSEDEVVLKSRRLRRPPKRYVMSPSDNEVSVIDLSKSETKRNTKHGALQSSSGSHSEKKKNARKKKLYIPEQESAQDIEPLEVRSCNLNIYYYI